MRIVVLLLLVPCERTYATYAHRYYYHSTKIHHTHRSHTQIGSYDWKLLLFPLNALLLFSLNAHNECTWVEATHLRTRKIVRERFKKGKILTCKFVKNQKFSEINIEIQTIPKFLKASFSDFYFFKLLRKNFGNF